MLPADSSRPQPYGHRLFSTEFAISDCMAIYSGGLGVVAGDHLKSTRNLDRPLTGVDLPYQNGCFRQNFTADG